MGTTVNTFTNASGTLQPFIGSGGGKFIDNFSTSDLVAGYTDPYSGIAYRKIESVQMTVGGTSGTAGAGRMGLWKSAGVVFDYAAITLNGTTATSSSATASVTATINAVIASGVTYYAGVWGSSSIAAKRNNTTGSFSSYSGTAASTTVSTTYNPGNLNFVLKYYYLPNAPTGVTASATGPTTATVSWTASSDPGGYAASTLRYKIYYTSLSSGSGVITEETSAGVTSYDVTGLRPGETYQFTVAAMNDVVPTGTNSYTSTDSSVYIDSYSSGPFSTASTAVQMPGGIYNGSAWKPYNRYRCQAGAQTAGTSYIFSYSNYGYVSVPSVANISAGDYLTVRGTPYNDAELGYVSSVDYGNNTIYYYSSTFNNNPYDLSGSGGTVLAWRSVSLKRYNGTSWTTVT